MPRQLHSRPISPMSVGVYLCDDVLRISQLHRCEAFPVVLFCRHADIPLEAGSAFRSSCRSPPWQPALPMTRNTIPMLSKSRFARGMYFPMSPISLSQEGNSPGLLSTLLSDAAKRPKSESKNARNRFGRLEPAGGFEPSTRGLRNRSSSSHGVIFVALAPHIVSENDHLRPIRSPLIAPVVAQYGDKMATIDHKP